TATYHQTPYMLDYEGHVDTAPRTYGALGTSALNRYYKASDGWFFLAIPEGSEARLAEALGLDEISEATLEEKFGAGKAAGWVQSVRDAGLSAQEVVHGKDLMVDPYVKARGLSVTQDVEGVGLTTAPGVSVRLSRTPMRVGEPRQPGGDAKAILAELGMADELEKLERAWVLQSQDLPKAW